MQKTLKVNHKLLPFLTKPQPIKVAYGGRGSGKTMGICDMAIVKMESQRIDLYCLREFQESIADSVHRTLSRSVDRLELDGWDCQEQKIVSPWGNRTTYKGAARNATSIQGAESYNLSIFSEAHTASQESIDRLLPTILRKPGAQCWFEANPQSSSDPFSQRFIVPYLDEIEANGFYEDDLHYIVKVNWRHNPWWNEEQERLRAWDYENLPRAKYDWIWEGMFNDKVDNGLIQPEWFDACVDAHIKLGFKPRGADIVTHDPADTGNDPKALAHRKGSVIVQCEERTIGDVNDACDWALGYANAVKADAFIWDRDGLGLSLRRQINDALPSSCYLMEFSGGLGVDDPKEVYNPVDGVFSSRDMTNDDVFYNRRAQRYWNLRDRCYNTYLSVVRGMHFNEDELISFSSACTNLAKLRTELIRMPLRNNANGVIQICTKKEMAAMKPSIPSPNLADAVMMSMEPIKVKKVARELNFL